MLYQLMVAKIAKPHTPPPASRLPDSSRPGAPTVTLGGAMQILGLKRSQIENMVRSAMTTPHTPAAGTGHDRRFDRDDLKVLAMGGELLKLGYMGHRLRFTLDFIVGDDDWGRLLDPASRTTAPAVLALLPGQTDDEQPIHLPFFLPSFSGFEAWLSGDAPSATVIHLGKMFDRVDERFDAYQLAPAT